MPTDNELTQLALSGNLAAFEKLVLKFERPLFAYLVRLLRQREDAEDITQETFLRAFKNLAQFNPQQSFKTWLYTIATHAAYDWLRRRGRRGELLLLDDPEQGIETKDDSPAYYSIEVQEDVARAMETLRPEYRAVLLLYYWEELALEDIAQALSKPVGTIKTYLFRARQEIKTALVNTYGPHIQSNPRDESN